MAKLKKESASRPLPWTLQRWSQTAYQIRL